MRPNRLLLPTASTTSTRASRVPSISSRLAPRSLSVACFPGKGDRGFGRFTTRRSASAGDPGSRMALSAVRPRTNRASGTPVALPEERDHFRDAYPKAMPRPRPQELREEQPTSLARDAFHRPAWPRPTRGGPISSAVT